MFHKNPNFKTLKSLLSTQKPPSLILSQKPKTHSCTYTQIKNYVNVYMKWKKDSYFDSIEHIHKSMELKPIISLKNFIAQNPNGCIPISHVSKRGFQFDIKIKVARFLRQYPSIFEEFTGPQHNLPWFRLTQEAAEIDREEKRVIEECEDDLRGRLKRFILMSKDKVLPFKIIQGMVWNLGLPEDFLLHIDQNLDDGSFTIVELENGLKGLSAENKSKTLSVLQKNAMRKKGLFHGATMEAIEFPLFPSKGLRLKTKIKSWLDDFQTVPYTSPYEDYSHLDHDSDISEKRLVGFFHELLSLFVEHSVERKRVLCLKKYFGLPQKVHKVFERHPHIFYVSSRNKTRTVILKEAYGGDEVSMERHPLLRIRLLYIELLKESKEILKKKKKRRRSHAFEEGGELGLNSNGVDENRREDGACCDQN